MVKGRHLGECLVFQKFWNPSRNCVHQRKTRREDFHFKLFDVSGRKALSACLRECCDCQARSFSHENQLPARKARARKRDNPLTTCNTPPAGEPSSKNVAAGIGSTKFARRALGERDDGWNELRPPRKVPFLWFCDRCGGAFHPSNADGANLLPLSPILYLVNFLFMKHEPFADG